MRLRLALVLALAGCPHGGTTASPRTVAGDGLAIAIYTPGAAADGTAAQPAAVEVQQADESGGAPANGAATPATAVALIDDRRTVDVGADGTIHLPDVADGIELASLIVEPLDGQKLDVHTCLRDQDQRAQLAGKTATLTTREGDTVDGVVRQPDDGSGNWILEDGQGNAHFVHGTTDQVVVHGGGASEVRCAVDAAPGSHRVRLAYATNDLDWAASYRVDVMVADGDSAVASIQPTFTISGSSVIGARHATVSLLAGLPGGDITPRLAWQGEVDLGADDVQVQPAARSLPATLEHIYRGAVTTPSDNPRDYNWRPSFSFDVWDAIGLDDAAAKQTMDLPAGPALFTVTSPSTTRVAHGDWPAADPDNVRGTDVELWPSRDLIGYRERRQPYSDGNRLVEQYLFSVSNAGDQPITVWVEEDLRSGATWHQIRKAWPVKPQRRGDTLRFPVKIAAHKIERLGFEAEYRW